MECVVIDKKLARMFQMRDGQQWCTTHKRSWSVLNKETTVPSRLANCATHLVEPVFISSTRYSYSCVGENTKVQ